MTLGLAGYYVRPAFLIIVHCRVWFVLTITAFVRIFFD